MKRRRRRKKRRGSDAGEQTNEWGEERKSEATGERQREQEGKSVPSPEKPKKGQKPEGQRRRDVRRGGVGDGSMASVDSGVQQGKERMEKKQWSPPPV